MNNGLKTPLNVKYQPNWLEKTCFIWIFYNSIISYRLLYISQNNNCQFSWLNYVESIFNECGLSYVWLNQYFISEQWLKNSVKTCLQDQFYQTWHSNIDTGSKTLNYHLFKNKFELKIILISSTIEIYLLFVALGWITINYLLNTDDGKAYLGNSEFVIYVAQQILEMSSIIY